MTGPPSRVAKERTAPARLADVAARHPVLLLLGLAAVDAAGYLGMRLLDAAETPDSTHFTSMAAALLLSLVPIWLLLKGLEIRRREDAVIGEATAEELCMLRALIEQVPYYLYIKDKSSRFVMVNPVFVKHLRAESAEELLGRNDFDFFPHELASRYFEGERQILETGQPWFEYLESSIDSEGKPASVLTSKLLYRNADGEIAGILGIGRDITGQTRVEQELKEVRAMAGEARRAKGEFLANMSHEMRTPMNGVMGMTELALDTDLTLEQREYLQTVKFSADAMLDLINDILDFSKIEAGEMEIELCDFNLQECMETTLRTVSLRGNERQLELLCDMEPGLPELVRADQTRIRQALKNLLGNAMKFTLEGEVALRVRVQSEDESGLVLQFTVSDTGIGIPMEKQRLILEPFTQADLSTTRQFGGIGLGLTIAARLVEMMGGRIWLESEVHKGSDFHFTVPVKRAEVARGTVPISASGSSAMIPLPLDARVLTVDDNATNRRILDGILDRWGVRNTSVAGAIEAISELRAGLDGEDPYTLVLTDLHMPFHDGFDLAARLRATPELSRMPIVMLTSGGYREDAVRCQELGICAYLLKPVRQSELRDAIGCALGTGHKAPVPVISSSALGALPFEERSFAGSAGLSGGLSGAASSSDRGSSAEKRLPGDSLHVLLAEDNLVNQRLASGLLEKRGHTVVVAGDGKQALSALSVESFDLVLMDLQMPVMGGFEATAALRLREQGTGRHQPVIALTAHAMKGDAERCMEMGMDGYLSKPIRVRELDVVLQRCLERRRWTAGIRQVEGAGSCALEVDAPLITAESAR
ncbi:MAG TPA: response regulator [Acidisarcina sp.]